VYEHLAKLFTLFGKAAPEFKTIKEAQAGDTCSMDDGGSGVLSTDPDDADGALICTPTEAKAAKDEHGSQKALLKAIGDEQDRHVDEVEKALESFAGAEGLKDLRDSSKTSRLCTAQSLLRCLKVSLPLTRSRLTATRI
jgi:hypothetical protein